jgi:hypothetical protein
MRFAGKSGSVIWRKLNSTDPSERKAALTQILAEWLSERELLHLAWIAFQRAERDDER